MDLEQAKARVREEVDRRADLLLEVSHRIHGHPELLFAETFAADVLASALGTDAEVETPEGTVRIRIPAGSSSGRKIRLRGRGLSQPGGSKVRIDCDTVPAIIWLCSVVFPAPPTAAVCHPWMDHGWIVDHGCIPHGVAEISSFQPRWRT